MSEMMKKKGGTSLRRFKPYPAYKESGIEWLGDIPAHWDVKPFTKYVVEKSDYRGKTPEKVASGVFLVTARNVRMGLIDYECSQEFVAEKDYDEIMRRGLPKKGDVLFTTEAPLGNVALVDREGFALAQRIIRFRMNAMHFDSRFTLFAMMSDHFQAQLLSLSTGSTAEGLKASKLPMLRLVAPSLTEQHAIAAFLDRETARVDGMVAKKERLIELLQEKRTALITQAVTKGLDPNVPMKHSGVEWLGEIPEHWEVRRLKQIVPQITVGIVVTPSKYYVDEGVPCLRSLNIAQGHVSMTELVFISVSSNELHRKSQIFEGDLVVVRTGRAGTAVVVPRDLNGANCIDLLIIRGSAHIDSRFLYHIINSRATSAQVEAHSVGAIQEHYNTGTLANLCVPMVPPLEQRTIAGFLDCETARIDALVAKVRDAIDRLKELRTALISAAVTGKIDVREEVA